MAPLAATIRAPFRLSGYRGMDSSFGPNYANVLGNFISGGISNAYYPAADRGFGQTVDGALTVTAEGIIGAEFVEFWPDISRHLFKNHQTASRPAG
jgi:hypothetical protein